MVNSLHNVVLYRVKHKASAVQQLCKDVLSLLGNIHIFAL